MADHWEKRKPANEIVPSGLKVNTKALSPMSYLSSAKLHALVWFVIAMLPIRSASMFYMIESFVRVALAISPLDSLMTTTGECVQNFIIKGASAITIVFPMIEDMENAGN